MRRKVVIDSEFQKKGWIISLVIIFCLGYTTPAFSELSPGLKLGLGRAELFGRDTYEQNWKTVFSAGFTVEKMIWKRLGLETGLFYEQGGSIYQLDDEETGYREIISLSFINIPLRAKIYVWQRNFYSFYLAAGPALGVFLKARLKTVSSGEKKSAELENLEGQDLGFNLAGGCEFRLGPGLLMVEIVFRQGLDSISKEPDEDIRNRKLSLLFGFRF